MWPFSWFRKQREKHETVEDVYAKRGIGTQRIDIQGVSQMTAGTRGIALPPHSRRARPYAPASTPAPAPAQPSDDGLLTGIILGEMLAENSANSAAADTPQTDFQGFGGGESGGAGASGSWDAPASDPSPSCDTSSSDSSSSCDSGSSFDSGSSSGSDF